MVTLGMAWPTCSVCSRDAVFSHVQITTTGRHEVYYCDSHKRVHDRRVRDSSKYSKVPLKEPSGKTTEDIMAESAILIICRLSELGTEDSARALSAIRKCLPDE